MSALISDFSKYDYFHLIQSLSLGEGGGEACFTVIFEELKFYKKLNRDGLLRNSVYTLKKLSGVCMYFVSVEFRHGIFLCLQSPSSFNFL